MGTTRRVLVAILLFGVLATPGIARAAIIVPTVTIHVETFSGAVPIEGGAVTLKDYPATGWEVTGLTNSTGDWAYYPVLDPAKDYRLSVTKAGYSAYTNAPFSGSATPINLVGPPYMTPRGILGSITGSGGARMAGEKVDLFKVEADGSLGLVESVTADTVGDYGFYSPDPGDYHTRVAVPGYLTEWCSNSYSGTAVRDDIVLTKDPDSVERVASSTRFTTAVSIAREGFTNPTDASSWPDVRHVVIASGEDRAAADPLSAAGLCGLYDAPLFLVSSTTVPLDVKKAIKEIASDNKDVTVHIVGGPVSVPDARYTEIKSYVGSAGNLEPDRLASSGGRYELAAAIANRMKSVNGNPEWVLVANGADPAKFFDALALSTIAANKEFPILLVAQTSIPGSTYGTLDSLGNPNIVIGGGPATVSDGIKRDLDAEYGTVERWYGRDRYTTAIDIANRSEIKGWTTHRTAGVAAKLPDALSGGAMIGLKQGVLLITDSNALPSSTGAWLDSHSTSIEKVYVFGGRVSVTPAVVAEIEEKVK